MSKSKRFVMLSSIIVLMVVILNRMDMSSVSRILGVIVNGMLVTVRNKIAQIKNLATLTVLVVIFIKFINHGLKV